MSSMIKYHVVPGRVTSRMDGDVSFISGPRLADLYKLKSGEWMVCSQADSNGCFVGGVLHLYPRFDGNYKHPDEYMVKG